jgi:hypothetical protein
MLGWAHSVRGVPLEQLSLATLVPSPDREGVSQLMDYQHWRQQRGVAARSHAQPIKAVIVAARYLYHEQSSVSDRFVQLRPPVSCRVVLLRMACLKNSAQVSADLAGHGTSCSHAA